MLKTPEDFEKLERDILRRLSTVELASGIVNESVVALALEKYLHALEFSPRPIRWARDGQHAHALVAGCELASIEEALSRRVDRVFDYSQGRDGCVWTEARDNAMTTGHGGPLDIVKGLVRGYSVILSVPWSGYNGTLTGDRGRRTDPANSPIWERSLDALEYAARARAECAWALSERAGLVPLEGARLLKHQEKHPSYEEFWLPFVDAYEAGLWLFWITPAEVIALPRPRLQLDTAAQLHCADGPAVSWPEGAEQFYFLNGVHVSREIVETPATQLDARLLLRERNSEVRREIVRKIGIERVCQALGAECLDRAGNYELLLLDLQDGRTRPFLKMKNPSIGVYHIEGVAPHCRTVAEALAWRNQSDVPPSVLT